MNINKLSLFREYCVIITLERDLFYAECPDLGIKLSNGFSAWAAAALEINVAVCRRVTDLLLDHAIVPPASKRDDIERKLPKNAVTVSSVVFKWEV